MRDPKSFDEFYRATSPRILRYAVAVIGDHLEAEDAVQEAYAKAWRQWGKLVTHPAPEAWMRLVVSRLSTDRWRRVWGLRTAMVRRGPASDAVGPPGENTVMLVRALRTLPVRQRECLAMHYLYDMSVEDIADELAVASGTVKSWLSRGRAKLAADLSDLAPRQRLGANDV